MIRCIVCPCRVPIDLCRGCDAQAIEAQRAETVKQGSVKDESAVGETDAPNTTSQQHGKGGRG